MSKRRSNSNASDGAAQAVAEMPSGGPSQLLEMSFYRRVLKHHPLIASVSIRRDPPEFGGLATLYVVMTNGLKTRVYDTETYAQCILNAHQDAPPTDFRDPTAQAAVREYLAGPAERTDAAQIANG